MEVNRNVLVLKNEHGVRSGYFPRPVRSPEDWRIEGIGTETRNRKQSEAGGLNPISDNQLCLDLSPLKAAHRPQPIP